MGMPKTGSSGIDSIINTSPMGQMTEGGNTEANAAESAGRAQYAAAQQQETLAQTGMQNQINARAAAVAQAQQMAAMSPGEMNAINTMLGTASTQLSASLTSIAKEQAQLDAMDPQVKSAGQDLYNLLTGHSAAMLGPIQTQRNNQRAQLQQQLQSQMGPGWATSTAGIQAMTAFDQDTTSVMTQAQMQATQQATQTYMSTAGLQQQGQGQVTAQTNQAYGATQQANAAVLQANQNVVNRGLAAVQGAEAENQVNYMAPAQFQESSINTAGNPFAGQMIRGQQEAARGNMMFQTLTNASFMGMGFGSKGAGSENVGKGSEPSTGGDSGMGSGSFTDYSGSGMGAGPYAPSQQMPADNSNPFSMTA